VFTKRRSVSLIPAIVLLVALLASACSPAAQPTAAPTKAPAAAATSAPGAAPTTAAKPAAKLQGKEVKLAFIAPKTGPVADWGVEQDQVVQMAVKEINAAGGVGGLPLNIMFFDTQGKPDEAVSLTRKLYSEDKVLIVLGPHLSGEASVAFPIAVAMKAPIVSCCSAAPGVSAANRPWAFRLPQPDDKGLTAMIKKFVADNKVQKAVVAGDIKDAASKVANTQYIPDALKAAGATILTGSDPIGYNTGDTSFAAQATKIKDLNPDAIFMYGLPAEGGAFIKEIRRQGITKPIVTGSAFMATQFLQVGGDAVEGVVMNAVWDTEHPASKDFVANFRKAYNGKDPTMVGAYAYDSIYLMKAMIESTGVTNDPAQLAQDWQKLRDGIEKAKFNGVTGKTSFDASGDGVHTVFEAVVKGGKFVINYSKVLLDQ